MVLVFGLHHKFLYRWAVVKNVMSSSVTKVISVHNMRSQY